MKILLIASLLCFHLAENLVAQYYYTPPDSPYAIPVPGTRPTPRPHSEPNQVQDNPSRKEGQQHQVPAPPSEPAKKNKNLSDQRSVSFNVQAGYMYGEVHELVMASPSDTYPIDSQLDWKLQDTLHISAGFEAILEHIYLKLGAQFPLILIPAIMEDRDWRFDNPPGVGSTPYTGFPASVPSHHSRSNTENQFSFSVHGIFAANLFEKGHAPRLELGVSFMYMTWSWKATDAQGLYLLDNAGAFGSYTPTPSSGDTINYRVHYFIPAASARFSAKWGIYTMEVLLNYSPFTIFIDRNEHFVTKITSEGLGLFGQMLWGGVTNRLWLTANLSLAFGLRGKLLFRTRLGVRKQINNATGEQSSTDNAAGSEYFDIAVFLGLSLHL